MENLLEILNTTVAKSLGWTLVHSSWQILIVVGVYISSTFFVKNAKLKYWAGMGLLGLQMLFSITTFAILYSNNTMLLVQNIILTNTMNATWDQSIFNVLNNNISLIVKLWVVGSFILFARLCAGYFYVQKIKKDAGNLNNNGLDLILENLVLKMNIRKSVAIKASEMVNLPMIMGFFKPLILIPSAMILGFSSAQLEAIIAHELAHLRRQDYLLNGVQSIIEIIYFFHPALWWLSAQIRKERENCCDDIAVEITNNKILLAKTLIQLQEYNTNMQLSMAFGKKKVGFAARVKRIVGIDPNRKLAKESIWIGIGLLITVFTIVQSNAKTQNSLSKINLKTIKEYCLGIETTADTLIKDSTLNSMKIRLEDGENREVTIKSNNKISIKTDNDELQIDNEKVIFNGKEVVLTPENQVLFEQKMRDLSQKRKQLDEHTAQISVQSHKMNKHSRELAVISKPMDDLALKMGFLGRDMGDLSVKYSKSMEKKGHSEKEIEKLSKEYEAQMKVLDAKMEKLEAEMSIHSEKMEAVNPEMEAIELEIEKLEDPMEAISVEIDNDFVKILELLPADIQAKVKPMPPHPPLPPHAPKAPKAPKSLKGIPPPPAPPRVPKN